MTSFVATPFDISPTRLRVKKTARRMAVNLGRIVRGSRTWTDGSVRVLTYHRFGGSPLDPCCLQPQAFAAQLDWLGTHASVLTPAQFDAVMSGEQPAPPCAVLITIDDGHSSVAAHALPALDRRGLQAVLFVCPLLMSAADAAPAESGGFMNREQLAAASAGGHTIAPHGYSHRSLGRLPMAEAVREIDQARVALHGLPGADGPFFSFPFGTRADYSAALAAELEERGYRYCFTTVHGRCLPRPASVLLPRIKIEGGREQDLFPDIVRGCLDHWRFVDNTLYLLQQRGRM